MGGKTCLAGPNGKYRVANRGKQEQPDQPFFPPFAARHSLFVLSAVVAKPPAFWHSFPPDGRSGRLPYGCGCSSGVEHDLAKVGVEGSNPFARSKIQSRQNSISIRRDVLRVSSPWRNRFAPGSILPDSGTSPETSLSRTASRIPSAVLLFGLPRVAERTLRRSCSH